MKLYVVTGDTHTEGYGSFIELFLVTDDLESAEKLSEKLYKTKGYFMEIHEVEMNKEKTKMLGGYIE